MTAEHALSPEEDDAMVIDDLVARARAAQIRFEQGADQARYDRAALAAGWALMEPQRNRELSEMAVETTGLGNVADKITKNHRKTLGLLRDIKHAKTQGIIKEDAERGITEIARPAGVVAAVAPSTNPVATPTNNIVNALKCGNAIIVAPSPKGADVCARLIGYIHAEFDKAGIDRDLVQMVPSPASKAKTQRLMERADLLIVTGSQDNVRRAYTSGTPALGVGTGNVTVIVDETADLKEAAQKIAASKCFDNATSCSSENALVIVDAVYDPFMEELDKAGGRMLEGDQAEKLKSALFQDGKLNRAIIARDIDQVIAAADVDAEGARFLLVSGGGIGPDYPESGEKLSLVTTVYRAEDFASAKNIAGRLLRHQGAGHSIGLHSAENGAPSNLATTCRPAGWSSTRPIASPPEAHSTTACRSHLSMGCGTWGGNALDDNLNHRHFMNITKIIRTIPANEPELEEIFGDYWQAAGK